MFEIPKIQKFQKKMEDIQFFSGFFDGKRWLKRRGNASFPKKNWNFELS